MGTGDILVKNTRMEEWKNMRMEEKWVSVGALYWRRAMYQRMRGLEMQVGLEMKRQKNGF